MGLRSAAAAGLAHGLGSALPDPAHLVVASSWDSAWVYLGIGYQLRAKGMPVLLRQVSAWTACERPFGVLRDLDGATARTPVAMAVRGPRARALAAEVADTVTFPAAAGRPSR